MSEPESWRVPQFDQRVNRWRATRGQFMKLGVPITGWVLVRCEHCGRDFPTREWKATEKPALLVCSLDCLVQRKHRPPTLTASGAAPTKAKPDGG
jgi:hypothetical protein